MGRDRLSAMRILAGKSVGVKAHVLRGLFLQGNAVQVLIRRADAGQEEVVSIG